MYKNVERSKWIRLIFATIAQLAVQLTCNQEVGGSIPSGGTIFGEVCLVAMAPDCKLGTLETP